MNRNTLIIYSVFLVAVLITGLPSFGNSYPYSPSNQNDTDCIKLEPDSSCPLENGYLKFYLYNRFRMFRPYRLRSYNLRRAPFRPFMHTKVLIHGYTGWKDYAPNPELRQAYFSAGDYNIISVDWSALAKDGCYLEAANNVKPVGACLGFFLEELLAQRFDVLRENLHIIGFSLGAHVAGNAGRAMSIKPKRMTVLDPAFPLFNDQMFYAAYRVTKGDAHFMDAVHTNGGMKGVLDETGHVDFYMNNAVVQPGCTVSNSSCSHYHAVLYFAESINSKIGFWGYPCESIMTYWMNECSFPMNTNEWRIMGEHVNVSARGNYFVQTNNVSLFAIGKTRFPRRTHRLKIQL